MLNKTLNVTRVEKAPIDKNHIKKAIEILAAECYGAMKVCNTLGGTQTPEWDILNNNTWKDIIQEGKDQGLDFNTMKCAVTETPLMDSATIQYALGLIDDAERKRIFHKSVKVTGKWPSSEPQ